MDDLELLQRVLLGEATQQIDRPVLLGDERVILAANDAACRLLDYSLPDLLTRGLTDISLLLQHEVEEVFALLRRRGQLTGTVWLRKRGGSSLAMEFRTWLVTVAAAPTWFAIFRPAVGEISSNAVELAEPVVA